MTQPSDYSLTSGDAARRLGVNVDTVQRWADSDKLPCLRTPGGFRRFRPEDVEKLAVSMLPGKVAS